MTNRTKVLVVGGTVGVVALLAFLMAGKGAASASPAAQTVTNLGAGDFPPSYYNLTFQQPQTVIPGTGYTPLFGFIGFGQSYF